MIGSAFSILKLAMRAGDEELRVSNTESRALPVAA